MQKICQTCKKDFEIRKEDLIFYNQIGVSKPNFCPDCRMQKRLAFRNERTFFKRKCDLCEKNMISLYSPSSPLIVYCHDCWWSDKWDAQSFALDYDPTKSFFEQYEELFKKVPRLSLMMLNSVRSDYTNGAAENKDCYLIFAAENCEDCLYSWLIQRCKNCSDCAVIYDSELCYECIDTRKSFNCLYGERLQECVDVLFSFDMKNSQNCIFCSNGRNMKFAIFNKPCTKEEFEEKKAAILSSYENIEKAKEQYEKIRSGAIVKNALATKCKNVTGDYIYNCHDGVRVFDAEDTKNSSYLGVAEGAIDSQDCDYLYFKPERIYNIMSTLQSNKCLASASIFYSSQVEYSDNCHNTSNCFGCIGLKKKNYCILNKQYTKEEYEKIKNSLVEEMKKSETYGDFLSPHLSAFGYNETVAQDRFPLTEKSAKDGGFRWQTETTSNYGKETIKKGAIPSSIENIDDKILDEIFVCENCDKNFRITKAELDFYKRMSLPLPHKDFECRHKDRMAKRNPRKLWHRKCMKDGCMNEFETAYSPDRKEIIYCEICYQQEVY